MLNYILAIISGLLLALSFPYPSINYLAWVGFIPLFLALKRSDLKATPFLGLVFGFTFFSVTLYWIFIFGFLAWFFLSLILSLYLVIFTVGSRVIMKSYRDIGQLILIPSLWALCEYIRSLGPWGFAWANIGSTVENRYIVQIASYIGEIGLGSIVLMANLVLLRVFEKVMKVRGLKIMLKGVIILTVLVLAWFATSPISKIQDETQASGAIKVAIIQPNISQNLKADLSNSSQLKDRYMTMTKEALKSKPDLIIWPESSLISYLSEEEHYMRKIGDALRASKTSLVLGSLDKKDDNVYNGAFYINRHGERQQYFKTHLVPFGEYVPMRSLIERVNNIASMVRDITPGRELKVFDYKGIGKFSTVICFESSDSALVGKMVKRGARMLLVVTNDGWFGKTAAAEQHFRITRMRAVEYGIPVVQAATTGISGAIAPSGEVMAKAGIEEKRILKSRLEFAANPSFFSTYGYLMPYLNLIAISIAILLRFLKYTPWTLVPGPCSNLRLLTHR